MQYTAIFFNAVKIENFIANKFDIFNIFAQNIYMYCGYMLEPPHQGGCNEYPQSMFLSQNDKNMYTTVHPSFTLRCFPDDFMKFLSINGEQMSLVKIMCLLEVCLGLLWLRTLWPVQLQINQYKKDIPFNFGNTLLKNVQEKLLLHI